MAYKNWDDIISSFQEVAQHPRFGENARAMLDLVPKLRENTVFKHVIFGTSHTVMFIDIPSERVHIYVYYSNETYRVWMCDLVEDKDFKEVNVNASQVVQTLEQYVTDLTNTDSNLDI